MQVFWMPTHYFDYQAQAYIVDGKVQDCSHPPDQPTHGMRACCYGRYHKDAPPVVDDRAKLYLEELCLEEWLHEVSDRKVGASLIMSQPYACPENWIEVRCFESEAERASTWRPST